MANYYYHPPSPPYLSITPTIKTITIMLITIITTALILIIVIMVLFQEMTRSAWGE